MRWKISHNVPPARQDHRQIELIAILALLVLIVSAWRYFDDSTSLPPSTTTFIVPSQSVHW